MSRDPLAEAVREHYQQQSLRPALVDRLAEMAELSNPAAAPLAKPESASVDSSKPQPRSRRPWPIVVLAAAVMLIAAAGAAVWLGPGRGLTYVQGQDSTQDHLIAYEIALNHAKDLAVEFSAGDYAALQARMNKLDFALRPSDRLANYQLLGARYCSIQGGIAAQLKFADYDGAHYTVYQTQWQPTWQRQWPQLQNTGANAPDGSLNAQSTAVIESTVPAAYMVDEYGVEVELWREGDVLFGLARNAVASSPPNP